MPDLTFNLTDDQVAGFESARSKTSFATVEEFISDHVGRIGDFYFNQSKEERVETISEKVTVIVFASDPVVADSQMTNIETVIDASLAVVDALPKPPIINPKNP